MLGSKLVILGGNGSGKSTLLQVISGFITPNKGKVIYTLDGNAIDEELIKNKVSLASPYLQLIEDFTPIELIAHVSLYKPFRDRFSPIQVLQIAGLDHARDKYIRHFSSGMKQRLRLSLAILADTPVLLLDEPLSNLDKNAIAWYHTMIDTYTKGRTVIVCSNAIEDEFYFCDQKLDISLFKQVEKLKIQS